MMTPSTEQRLERLSKRLRRKKVPDWAVRSQQLEDRIVAIAEGQTFPPTKSKDPDRDAWILHLLESRYLSWQREQELPPLAYEVISGDDRGRLALQRIFARWLAAEQAAKEQK
jgi:hypothetical protein